MAGGHHDYQWGHTTNALNDFCNLYVSFKDEEEKRNQRLEKAFINQKVFATEKLDGTNVSKDECGQMYGRRCLIGKESEFYLKTSLVKVKQANISKLKMYLCKEADIDQNEIQKILVYGELMCNTIYDYKERNIVGDWRVFGAMMCVGEEKIDEVFGKLIETGFAVRKSSGEEKIYFYPSTKFFSCVTQCGMETVNVRSNGHSIAQIVSDNLEDMRRGRLEGIMFTTPSYEDDDEGHKVVKWKGAQEYQPSGEKFVKEVCEDIKTKHISDALKMFYKNLADVASVGPETNPLILNKDRQQRIKKDKAKQEKERWRKKKDEGGVSPDDKKMINHGIYHSMNKFDDIATYSAEGSVGIEIYIKLLQDEAKKHYVEEKPIVDNVVDEKVVTFINTSVVKIVRKLQNEKNEKKKPDRGARRFRGIRGSKALS